VPSHQNSVLSLSEDPVLLGAEEFCEQCISTIDAPLSLGSHKLKHNSHSHSYRYVPYNQKPQVESPLSTMRFFTDNVACRSASDQIKTSEDQSQSKRSQHFDDVWYRRFLKPLSRSQAVPYRESFRRRVLRAVGIPVAELQGVHEVFKLSHRRYSPLHGMMVSKPEGNPA
jgi:hypothetical protein